MTYAEARQKVADFITVNLTGTESKHDPMDLGSLQEKEWWNKGWGEENS